MPDAMAWMVQQQLQQPHTKKIGRPPVHPLSVREEVRRLLVDTSLTQREIAKAAGVGRHFVADVIRRERIERPRCPHPGTNQFSKIRQPEVTT